MANFSIGSLNCRGLSSDNLKRKDIFDRCRSRYDVTFIIDSHCKQNLEPYWKSEWGYNAYFSSYTSNSRGIIILFRNSFKYELHREIADTDGNYLILDITIFDHRMTLAAIYGPNEDNPTFFHQIQRQIENIGNSSVILGGDWNVPLDYDNDTLKYIHRNNEKSNEQIKKLMFELDVHDVWRNENPDKNRYTWRGPNHKQSRLDYFLISSDLHIFLTNSDIETSYRSDHSPIKLEFNFIEQTRGRGVWKFNNSLLEDKEYIEIIKTCLSDTLNQYRIGESDSFSINDQLL